MVHLKLILKKHQLRVTDCRLDILDYLLQSDHAISAPILEEKFPEYDRVTLYRTISSFVEKGILHSIPDDSGVARYGICHDTCSPEKHSHDHIHFKCTQCGNIECVPFPNSEEILIPGYFIEEVEMIVTGKCKTCVNES